MAKAKISIDQEIWYENHQALVAAKENALELINLFYEKSGSENHTKKEKCILDMYEKEARSLSDLLEYSSNNGGIPF